MGILDGAIALDKKRAESKRASSARALETMEAEIRSEFQERLDAAVAAQRAAEERATSSERALADAQAGATRSGAETGGQLAAAQAQIAGLERELERLNASLDRMQAMHKEMGAATPKTSVSDAPPPPAPVAYNMEIKRGSDGLLKSVRVTPIG